MDNIDFAEAWRLFEIAQSAECYVASERQASTDAEITEGAVADWYLVQTAPGEDARALRWLARRRFGVFRPMHRKRVRRAGKTMRFQWQPVFPGWLFVFCWDIEKMFTRIVNCPGVVGILCDRATSRPVAVDAPEMTCDGRACIWPRIGFIDRLRALSWIEGAGERSNADVRAARNSRRAAAPLSAKERRKLARLKAAAREKRIWNSKQWENANRLEPRARIRLLMRAIDDWHRRRSVVLNDRLQAGSLEEVGA